MDLIFNSMSFLLLLLLSSKVLAESIIPPRFDNEEDLIVNGTDQPFTLTCRGSKPLQWSKPEIDDMLIHYGDSINITHKTENDTLLPHVSTLQISPYVSDTGKYYCHHIGATDFETDEENVDTTYVYIAGYRPFVEHHLDPIVLPASETLEIKCITTHPDIHVSLFIDKRNITNKNGVTFSSKQGFIIKNVQEGDSGRYKCKAGNEEQSVMVTITARNKALCEQGQLKIESRINQYFVRGEMFSLKCEIVDLNVTFTWKYPNKGANYTWDSTVQKLNNTTHQTSILVIPSASQADSGLYTCTAECEDGTQNYHHMNITVLESMKSFVNFSSSSNKTQATKGELATWKTIVMSYPSPKIIYTNWRGEVLQKTERMSIEFDDDNAFSWLKIKDVASSDFGNYTVHVTAGNAYKSATSLFEIKSDPNMKIYEIPQFLGKRESLKVTCRAQGFPRADISLQFQACVSVSSCTSPSNIMAREEETDFPAPGNIVTKSVNFSPKTSGILWCFGENDMGSGNDTAEIRISDIRGIFILRQYGQDETTTEAGDHWKSITVVENDDFSLICGATKFDYKSIELIFSPHSDSSVTFNTIDSEFSWQRKTAAVKASKILAGNYTCTAEPHKGKQPHVKSITVNIIGEENVRFEKEAHMMYQNKTVVVKGDGPLTINCNITGIPKPTIQWMKDNKNLTIESESFDKKSMSLSSDFKVLSFTYVIQKHMGKYTCIAENRLNKVTGSLTLKMPDSGGMSLTHKLTLAISIVGIVVLGFVVVFLFYRVKKEKQIRSSIKRITFTWLEKGHVDSLNPACTADQQADMLPYDKEKWEVPRENITLGKQLGSGTFGRVIKADVTGLEGPAITTVAIKMCKNDIDASQMQALISELKIMMYLGKHLNIVNLMGASTVKISEGELWILVEYCHFGNLLEFMQRHRRKFTNQICPVTGKINRHLVLPPSISPALSEDHPPTPAIDQDGYLAPSARGFILSDPPLGHSAKTDPGSTMLTSPSRSSVPLGVTGQFANNPTYSMNLTTVAEDPKEEVEGNEDSRKPRNLLRKGSRLLSIGSISLSESTSVSNPPRSPDSATTFIQPSSHSPLSPTDTCFMGENYSDLLLEVGNVPGVTASFTNTDLICWGWQMAQGMNYLSERKILHGDLAARNLLLHHNNVVKISDFGLSRNMYRNDNYVKKGDDLLPIKWMSIEAICDRIFSKESDVWAFGITLWEIFSLGSTPYAGMEINNEFVEQLENGYRMNCPKYANQEIYTIMKHCWEKHPLERPSFSKLVDQLGHMISDLTEEYLSQNETYMQMNKERFSEETDYLSMMADPNFESRTMPDEPDCYISTLGQTTNSISTGLESPNAVAFSNVRSPLPSSNISLPGNTYLPMGSVKSQSPSDIKSPHPSEPSRFTFPSKHESSGLTSVHEEENHTLLEPEESSENSALRRQPSIEGNLSKQTENEFPDEENNMTGSTYVNL